MTIAFPAYHTQDMPSELPRSDLRCAVIEAFHSLKWSIGTTDEFTIIAKIGFNIWSSGERIRVEFIEKGLRITSTCVMVTQCFDWGKNRRNVRRLIKHVVKLSE